MPFRTSGGVAAKKAFDAAFLKRRSLSERQQDCKFRIASYRHNLSPALQKLPTRAESFRMAQRLARLGRIRGLPTTSPERS